MGLLSAGSPEAALRKIRRLAISRTSYQLKTRFWAEQGCLLLQPLTPKKAPHDEAPTRARRSDRNPGRLAYPEPCRRPTTGRLRRQSQSGPALLQYHGVDQAMHPMHPGQPIWPRSKSLGIAPLTTTSGFLERQLGIRPPSAPGAVGWGGLARMALESTQFTYFQQCAPFDLPAVSIDDSTYGLERLA